MRFETKYDIGQTAWALESATVKDQGPCHLCDGTGSVAIKGLYRRCPDCAGGGNRTTSEWTVYHPRLVTIRGIRVSMAQSQSGDFRRNESYTTRETGAFEAGWDVDRLFATQGEARAEAGRLHAARSEALAAGMEGER